MDNTDERKGRSSPAPRPPEMIELISGVLASAVQKLSKWKMFFASWQLGTRSSHDGECKAVKDHRELTLMLRAEVNTLTVLLERKGLISQVEFISELAEQCVLLDQQLEQRFPGFSTSTAGLEMKLPECAQTMQELDFPR